MSRIPRLSRFILLALLVSAGAGRPAWAQPAGAPARPRIGLALGGGSARGLAHIGVLEWLDEHRVPVDAVAGTSMGGLVGGAFATGIPARDIRALIAGIDWSEVLSTGAPFSDAPFRRKQDRRAFPAGIEFGIKRGLWLPRSLNPGQRIALLLDSFTMPYSALPDFDALPTPFRCVAFDINASESVVLGRGVLAEALRATMALPGIFPPVTIDGRLLVDGGFLDNVPVEVARRMPVDVVIAVDVTRDPAAIEEVTAFSMLGRAVDAVMAAGARRNVQLADVVLKPDIRGLTALDWNSADEWRRRGYAAAEARAAELTKYAVGEAEYEAYLKARASRRRTAPIVPASVSVRGVAGDEQATLVRRFGSWAGRPLDVARLERELLVLSGTSRYELLTYNLAETADGTALEITAVPKANGPAFLTLGLSLNNVDASNFAMSVEGRSTVYDIVGRGSELRLDFAAGTRLHAGGELYWPIGVSWLFAAPRAYAASNERNLFADGAHVAQYRFTQAGGGADLGVSVGRVAELRGGYDIADADDTLQVGDPRLSDAHGTERVASIRLGIDTQDTPVVPSRGVHASAVARRYFSAAVASGDTEAGAAMSGPQEFWQAEFDSTVFCSPGRRNRLFLRVAGGTSFDADPAFYRFSLGGPFWMSAYLKDELRGPEFALAAAGYMRQMPGAPSWLGPTFVAVWAEAGSAFQSRATAEWHADIAAGLVIDSLIGPVFAGGSVGPGGHWRFYASLGPLFR